MSLMRAKRRLGLMRVRPRSKTTARDGRTLAYEIARGLGNNRRLCMGDRRNRRDDRFDLA